MHSVQRVKTLLAGQLPDRPPLYDVIRNDAVIEHFAGEKIAPDLDCLCCYRQTCDKQPNCMQSISVDDVFQAVRRQLDHS